AAESEELAARLETPVRGPLVIKNGDLFDADHGVVRPRTTVLVDGPRIIAVGPDDSVLAPAGATVIDATGSAIIPGLWDMHAHGAFAIQRLAAGITTERNLGADLDVAVPRRDGTVAGRVVGPRQVLAGFLEGPGRRASPTDALVRTEAEARQWIARYDSMGYVQIKVYNLVHPDLLPVIVEEAHRRGMRVGGHIPRGLTVPAAIGLGLDEVHHAAFLLATFFQDSLWVPTLRQYSAVARAVAPGFDVDGNAMSELIATLRAHRTVVDGTFNIYLDRSSTGPAALLAQQANANHLRLIKRLYDAGVTIVPGTDNPPATAYNDELELYQRAGIPAVEVLKMATIIPAQVMRQDQDYGSIASGKVADLIVVNGMPTERVTDLRNVEQVVRGGRLYDARRLRAATGNP
ncbi:MAG TPA: amidohydrolase family protein, partial [Gemmatimonadales bacterium]|nr:amidohydrolase family protein [Gemmatimonadales bacterium]